MFDSLRQLTRDSLPRVSRTSVRPGEDLFDDEFQRKLETLAIVSRRVFAGRMRAERRSKKKGSGVEFADHRDYAPGDDFRFVDWNIYQRFDKLLVRLYEEEEDLQISFIVDCSASMGFGTGKKFDQARRLAAALAYVGLANLDRVAIIPFAARLIDRLPPSRGKHRIFRVFEFLRTCELGGQTDLADCMKTFVAQNKRRGLAVVISDFYDPVGFEQGLNTLRYNKFEPFVLQIYDKKEAEPELHGDLALVDCETGDTREVTISRSLLEQYKAAHEAYCKELEAYSTKCVNPKLV